MNRESNAYTIIYASAMVVLVAILLAFTSQSLKNKQAENGAVDQMKQILRSIQVTATNEDAAFRYKELITDSYVIDVNGEKTEGDAFGLDVIAEYAKPVAERHLPVYEATIDGAKKYIIYIRGAGLWGPLWGFISFDEDRNTVYGADFGHAGETPGLGAEIEQPFFAKEFIGKKVFDPSGQFVSIAVVKPGKAVAGKDYVDGISGGTITSQGVEAMLLNGIGDNYVRFLSKKE